MSAEEPEPVITITEEGTNPEKPLESFVEQKQREPKKEFTPQAPAYTIEEILEEIEPGTPPECVGAIRAFLKNNINYTFFMHDCTDHGNETSCQRFEEFHKENQTLKKVMANVCGKEFDKLAKKAIKDAKEQLGA